MKKNRRRQFFANKLHRQTFLLFSVAALVPTALAAISLYYLIFGVTANQMGFLEAIASNIIPASRKVIIILLVVTPIVLAVLLVFAYRMTHAMLGPYDRIIKELDDRIKGKESGDISLRKKDKFWPLVNKINRLLHKIQGS
ncbi:MAG: hypothetical protein JSW17_00435 [Candidatus Omnitrophota bacterium]|nr:MAG: hypothetical protein JSW17_00435 [Candidatus Omnitrophota bacterium]